MVRPEVPDHAVDRSLGMPMVEVAHLKWETGENGGDGAQQDPPTGEVYHLQMLAEAAQVLRIFRLDVLVAQAEQVYLMAFGQPLDQVVGTQLVALFQRVGHTGKHYQQPHVFAREA
jgi:hypothetical protein